MFNMFNAPANNAAGPDPIKEGSDKTFMADVIEASRDVPVIVDFWATWCGPCKQLGPLLEKTVRAAKGKVKMVKIDTDKNPMVAGQLRVQSIPAVYAFFQGRPVDAFVGALPESQIKQWVDRLIQIAGSAGGADAGPSLEEAMALAKQALESGDVHTAMDVYGQLLEADPTNAAAYAGLIRAMMASGDLAEARAMLDAAPEDLAKHAELQGVRTALQLLEETKAAGPIPELMEKVAQDKEDHQARFDLAMALFAADKREAAMEELLEIVRRDREWNEQAARKQLLKFFEAFGPTDKLTVQGRRRLSSILFS